MAKIPWNEGDEIAPGVRFVGTTNKGTTIVVKTRNPFTALRIKLNSWLYGWMWRKGWRPKTNDH